MKNTFTKFITPFYGWGLTVSRLKSYYDKTVYFLLLSQQEFLVLRFKFEKKTIQLTDYYLNSSNLNRPIHISKLIRTTKQI